MDCSHRRIKKGKKAVYERRNIPFLVIAVRLDSLGLKWLAKARAMNVRT